MPELGCSVFILPVANTKNGEERVVVLNRIARSVLDARFCVVDVDGRITVPSISATSRSPTVGSNSDEDENETM